MSLNIRTYRTNKNQSAQFSIVVIGIIFLVHAAIRFGGLENPLLIPFSMMIIWPLPWLLFPRSSRKAMDFDSKISWWFLFGPLSALLVLAISAAAAWWFFGDSDSNWFVQHASFLAETTSTLPENTKPVTLFLAMYAVLLSVIITTLPAMIFSPLGEEFLFRGFIQGDLTGRMGVTAAIVIQAAAFALVHLAHYGLNPLQPDLIWVWLPSMFAACSRPKRDSTDRF